MTVKSYTLEFRGHATPLVPGVLITRASAPCTILGRDGEALLEARVSLADESAFDLVGTITFGRGNALRFRSLGPGVISPSPEPGLRLGTAVCEVDGGAGELAGATGRITSSFLVSETGELTDHHLGVIFAAQREKTTEGVPDEASTRR